MRRGGNQCCTAEAGVLFSGVVLVTVVEGPGLVGDSLCGVYMFLVAIWGVSVAGVGVASPLWQRWRSR